MNPLKQPVILAGGLRPVNGGTRKFQRFLRVRRKSRPSPCESLLQQPT